MNCESIGEAMYYAVSDLERHGAEIKPGKWQAITAPDDMIELIHYSFTAPIPPTQGDLALQSGCNLPWAEDHFLERVCGEPLNPGEQYKNWPFYRGNVPQHQTEGECFSHTYMERFWPKSANTDIGCVRRGIRYAWGDLLDVVDLLIREPMTRQAYLPVWFPEDTGATHGERVPCTLGYHFMRRGDLLHCLYPIRSCDIMRHLPDDIYLAGRLVQWIIDRAGWSHVVPGNLTMTIGSLHCWASERELLRRRLSCM